MLIKNVCLLVVIHLVLPLFCPGVWNVVVQWFSASVFVWSRPTHHTDRPAGPRTGPRTEGTFIFSSPNHPKWIAVSTYLQLGQPMETETTSTNHSARSNNNIIFPSHPSRLKVARTLRGGCWGGGDNFPRASPFFVSFNASANLIVYSTANFALGCALEAADGLSPVRVFVFVFFS